MKDITGLLFQPLQHGEFSKFLIIYFISDCLLHVMNIKSLGISKNLCGRHKHTHKQTHSKDKQKDGNVNRYILYAT